MFKSLLYWRTWKKVFKAKAIGVGNSDHLGVEIKKLAKPIPQEVRRRCHKNPFSTRIYKNRIYEDIIKLKYMKDHLVTWCVRRNY